MHTNRSAEAQGLAHTDRARHCEPARVRDPDGQFGSGRVRAGSVRFGHGRSDLEGADDEGMPLRRVRGARGEAVALWRHEPRAEG